MPLYQGPQPASPPNLIIPRVEARQRIEAQLAKAREIRSMFSISLSPNPSKGFQVDLKDLQEANKDLNKWRKVTYTLLTNLFSNTSKADEFRHNTSEVNLGIINK